MTFHIFAGLGGSPRLIDVGGVPYLMPIVKKDKVSNSNFNTESEIMLIIRYHKSALLKMS